MFKNPKEREADLIVIYKLNTAEKLTGDPEKIRIASPGIHIHGLATSLLEIPLGLLCYAP